MHLFLFFLFGRSAVNSRSFGLVFEASKLLVGNIVELDPTLVSAFGLLILDHNLINFAVFEWDGR